MEKNYLFAFLIFLLNIVLISLSTSNTSRNLYNYYSEIHLVIQGNGTQRLLGDRLDDEPSEVLVNGKKDSACKNTCYLEGNKNNIVLIFKKKITSCAAMFSGLSNITEIDLSNFDTSEVINMNAMFQNCINLTKINFGNMITSSVKQMVSMFYGCSKLMTINLSHFDTSKVEKMGGMFNGCSNLKYLDLSNFKFSNNLFISSMFQDCKSLIYINIPNFIFNNNKHPFDGISSETKVCYNNQNGNNFPYPDCNNICFKENRKLDIDNNECIMSCKDNGYEYEYNNICYRKCPQDTYILFSENKNYGENVSECFDETPQGYYLDINNNIYKPCYKNCKYCYGKGNKTNHNCKECISNYSFLNNSLYNNNCYEKCNNYYYFNDSYDFNCVGTCQGKNNKLIKDKKKCIDDCKNDDTHKYEYNNICYEICPNRAYSLENGYICLDVKPKGYYLDTINKIYKKCYETCSDCDKKGDNFSNNCLECKENYTFYKDSKNISNCFKQCNNYYYFNESNEFNCVDKCQGK